MSRLRMALLAGLGVVVLALVAFGVALATVDMGRVARHLAAQIERETGRAVRFGEVSLGLLPRPSLALRDVTVANAAWAKGEDGGAAAPMLRLGLLQAQVELWPLVVSRELHISRLEARDGEIRLEVDAQGRRNWDVGGSGGDASAPETVGDAAADAVPVGTDAAGLPRIAEVRLDNIVAVWRDGRVGGERRLSVSSLKLDTMPDGRFAVAASLAVDGEAVAVKGELDRPAGFLAPGGPFAATLDMTLPGTVAKLAGGLANAREGRGLDATLSVEAEPLRALQGIAGVALPAVKFQAAARLEGDLGGVVKAEGVRLVAGRSDLAGKAELHMEGARPRVVAALESRRLDFVEALPKAAAPAPAPSAAPGVSPGAAAGEEGPGRVFADAPFALPDLRGVDADVSLRVGEVVAPSLRLSEATLRLVLEDGDLAARPFGFVLLGSHVAGDARLNTREAVPAMAVDVAAQRIDLGAVLALAGQTRLVEAKGDLVVSLRGRGASPRAVAESLEGNASLVVGPGTLAQDYVEGLGLGPLKAAVPQLQRALDARMNCAIARFDVKAGVATARLLVLDAGDLSIVGRGSVNLGEETIALELPARLRIAGVPGLGGVVIPLQVRGTLLDPAVTAGRGVRGGNPLAALGRIVLDPGASRTNPCGGLGPLPGR